jgi:hypothetical protein
MDLAGAIAQFPDRRGTSAGVDSRRDLALVPLSLGRASAGLGSSSARANQSRCDCDWGAANAGRRLKIGRDLSYLCVGLRLPRAGACVAMSALDPSRHGMLVKMKRPPTEAASILRENWPLLCYALDRVGAELRQLVAERLEFFVGC